MASVFTNTEQGQEPPNSHLAGNDRPKYDGARGKIFKLAFTRMAITILTLGIGRFWMVTRLRRHYWSSIRIGGDPLEYTGKALELLLGFMMALVIIAIYLIIVNLGLTFVGLSVLQGNVLALQLPLLALLPLSFWAQYRVRRYILARTRWRGVRFGLMPGAWGYTWRAMGLWILTFFTLGLLYPLMQIRLARYVAERTRYGHLAFRQEGRWQELLTAWLWVWLPIPIAIVGMILMMTISNASAQQPNFLGSGFSGILISAFYLWFLFACVRYGVVSFNYLNSNKVLGGETRFAFNLTPWSVIWIIIAGGFFIGVIALFATALLSAVAYFVLVAGGQSLASLDQVLNGDFTGLGAVGAIIAASLVYLMIIPVYVALTHAFITHPLIKAATESGCIINLGAAERAKQRDHDEQAEAGGFADALDADLGGAF